MPVVLALLGWAAAWAQPPAPVHSVSQTPHRFLSTTYRGTRLLAADTTASGYPFVALTATAGVGNATGRVDLLPIPSPFGVAVTADGSQRYRTRLVVHGLPDPSTLGPYTTYVAWVASWFLENAERLGTVAAGEHELAEVHWSKFRILITAERSPDVRGPTGPVVLRGISPSGRMLPSEHCNLGFMGPC